ncbi:MAG TPA: cyclodeaminase/cyclohydrolase family protein [Gaiellaceae bacterium]|nr:cyclodeaminase/cyclohydrolase family protein [Gaiellaceae bacterium]
MAGPSASSSAFDETLTGFVEAIAAETPAPGGGSVSAVVTTMAAGLVAMVARFSRAHWDEAAGAVCQADALRARAAPLAQEDADAYEAVLTAMRMPKELEPEVRNALIGDALSRAADVPIRIAETAADVAELAATLAELGNPNLRGDAAAAALLSEAAARAAANLVEINLATSEGDDRVDRARAVAAAAGAAAERALAAGP